MINQSFSSGQGIVSNKKMKKILKKILNAVGDEYTESNLQTWNKLIDYIKNVPDEENSTLILDSKCDTGRIGLEINYLQDHISKEFKIDILLFILEHIHELKILMEVLYNKHEDSIAYLFHKIPKKKPNYLQKKELSKSEKLLQKLEELQEEVSPYDKEYQYYRLSYYCDSLLVSNWIPTQKFEILVAQEFKKMIIEKRNQGHSCSEKGIKAVETNQYKNEDHHSSQSMKKVEINQSHNNQSLTPTQLNQQSSSYDKESNKSASAMNQSHNNPPFTPAQLNQQASSYDKESNKSASAMNPSHNNQSLTPTQLNQQASSYDKESNKSASAMNQSYNNPSFGITQLNQHYKGSKKSSSWMTQTDNDSTLGMSELNDKANSDYTKDKKILETSELKNPSSTLLKTSELKNLVSVVYAKKKKKKQRID